MERPHGQWNSSQHKVFHLVVFRSAIMKTTDYFEVNRRKRMQCTINQRLWPSFQIYLRIRIFEYGAKLGQKTLNGTKKIDQAV